MANFTRTFRATLTWWWTMSGWGYTGLHYESDEEEECIFNHFKGCIGGAMPVIFGPVNFWFMHIRTVLPSLITAYG